MEIDDGHKVLRVLQAAFPQYPNANGLPEDSVELYLRMLAEVNGRGEHMRDFADAMEAARHWVLGEDHFPLVGELLDAIQREARKRAAATAPALPPAWEGLAEEDLPPGPPPASGTFDDMSRQANLERLREALREGVKRAPVRRPDPTERARIERRPPEPCGEHDHSMCAAGPVLARPKPKQ